MSWIPPAIGILGDVFGGLFGASSQEKANRANLKNAREQRAWEEMMANSAVQRRRNDIEKAGFNPVLAAVGPGASTPSVSTPTMEPTFDRNFLKGSTAAALMQSEQLRNMRADTESKTAEARIKNVEAKIREELVGQETEFRSNRFVEAREWDDLKTKILRSQDISSAAESKKITDTLDSLIATAQQQAKTGKLNLEALENIAKVGGIEAGRAMPIIKMIIDLMKD